MLRIQAHAKSDPGLKRDQNEDAFLCDPSAGVFIACDGVGGHDSGEVASQLTVSTISSYLHQYQTSALEKTKEEVSEILIAAIQYANAHVFRQGRADQSARSMAATLVVLWIVNQRAYISHLGDSRIYFRRQGQFPLLTEDHNYLAEQLRMGRQPTLEAIKSPQARMITRAIGTQDLVSPEVLSFEVGPGDAFLLCTDGLSDYYSVQEISDRFNKDPLQFVSGLIDEAVRRGGKDNLTGVSVVLDGVSDQDADLTPAAQVEALRKLQLFKYLDYREVLEALNLMELGVALQGETLIEEGSRSGEFFVLLRGTVEISKQGHKLAELGVGSCIGEMELISDQPKSATVRVLENCGFLKTNREALLGLMRKDHRLAVKLLWVLGQLLDRRLRAANLQVVYARGGVPEAEESPAPPSVPFFFSDSEI